MKSTTSSFADLKFLSDHKTMFCIQKVRIVEQKNGVTKWYLTISYYDCAEYVEQFLTFFYHTKSGDVNKRNDKMFRPMLDGSETLPIHNAFLTSTLRTYPKDGKQQQFIEYSLDWLETEPCECCVHADDKTAA